MTELRWGGKYDANGKKVAPVRLSLPFQDVETVNESAQQRQMMLDMWGGGRDKEWRNRLVWGDKKYVLPSLLPEFAGKVDLVYIDPLRPELEIKPLLEVVVTYTAKALGERQRVAVVTALHDLCASSDRIPGRVRPLDRRLVTHGGNVNAIAVRTQGNPRGALLRLECSCRGGSTGDKGMGCESGAATRTTLLPREFAV